METTIISGKGGTGKSCITAALATLSQKVVLADCDVDAANQHLLFEPTHEYIQNFIGSEKAVLNESECTNCGLCIDYCRFDAIYLHNGSISINEFSCDGCRLCAHVCPQHAITIIDVAKSRLYSGAFRNGRMCYGRLAPGEENSGRLVSLVREQARNQAYTHNINHIFIDGPPGIGCPVISSITGADRVIIITEPSLAGLTDLKRVSEIVRSFRIPARVIINKYDLNTPMTIEIKKWCMHQKLEILAYLPFDTRVIQAMVHRQSITEWAPDAEISRLLQSVFKTITYET